MTGKSVLSGNITQVKDIATLFTLIWERLSRQRSL